MCAPAYKPSPVGEGGLFRECEMVDEVSNIEIRFMPHPKEKRPLRGRGGVYSSRLVEIRFTLHPRK